MSSPIIEAGLGAPSWKEQESGCHPPWQMRRGSRNGGVRDTEAWKLCPTLTTTRPAAENPHSALLCSECLDPKQGCADIPVNKATDSEQAACNEFVIVRTFKGTVPCRSRLNGCFLRLPEVGSGRKTKANEALCLEENWHNLKLVYDLCWKGNKSRQFQIGVYSLPMAQGHRYLRFITSF